MTEDESQHIFEMLSAALRELGMEWALSQVLESIQVGRIVERKLNSLAEEVEQMGFPRTVDETAFRTAHKVTLPQVLEYSAKERLLMLIQAVEAVGNLAEIQHAAAKILVEFGGPSTISFVDDVGSVRSEVDLREAESRAQNVQALRTLLCELREEVDAN
jgi:hypothetical protein